jgi:hypothetical protein
METKRRTFNFGKMHDNILCDLTKKMNISMTEVIKRGIEAMAEQQKKKDREVKK